MNGPSTDASSSEMKTWGPQTDGIVFESYNGKSANDNPRAIFEAITAERSDIPLYWSVRDRSVDVPPGATSQSWKAQPDGTVRSLLAESGSITITSLITCGNTRARFYLQTWHGSPIKKLLWDIPSRKVPLTYRRLMKREVRQWDLLSHNLQTRRSSTCEPGKDSRDRSKFRSIHETPDWLKALNGPSR